MVREAKQSLRGVKVLEFAWAAVGPQIGRTLTEHGATVIRIESHRKPDLCRVINPFLGPPGINTSPFWAILNTNKYGIALDIAKPQGLEIAKRLIEWADIVTESFTPGTMKKLGLDYEETRKVKPDIIYLSTCSQGQSGPHALLGVYGMQTAPIAGFAMLTGPPKKDPALVYGAYTDYVSPWFAVCYLISALSYRDKTGKGMYLDHSQYEAALSFLAPYILDYTVNGRIMNRIGNRDPNAVPHGAYRCKGKDRWVAIAVFTNEEWVNFCKVIERPQWIDSTKFGTLENRRNNEDELDKLIEEWTVKYTAEEVITLLQSSGVTSGILQTMEDLFESDQQLQYRKHWVRLNHAEMGHHSYHNEAGRFSKTPAKFWKAAPCLGEDNKYVYKQILHLTDDDISNLLADGVITTEADIPVIGTTY